MTDLNWNSNTVLPTSRAATVGFTIILAVAFLGFVIGIGDREPARRVAPAASSSVFSADVLPSTTYTDVLNGRLHRPQPAQVLDAIRAPSAIVPDMTITPSLDARRVSLASRGDTRAYNGAPPVIPHAVDQLNAASCLACHGEGVRLGNRVARALPHPAYENCTQCHAPPPPDVLPAGMSIANAFDGVPAPWEGERAWPGAPPTIPHTTWMRDNCLACHGPDGWDGMETTHPWRDNCLQCHAPSATLDQSPFAGLPSPLATLDDTTLPR